MSFKGVHALFLISLLFTTSINPLVHGQIIGLGGLTVGGTLCCSPTGNSPGQGIAGSLVSLKCNILGATVTVGQATTNANGVFNITVPAIPGLLLGLPIVPCVASVQLPLSPVVCSVLSTTNGVLVSTIQSLGTIVSTTLGLIQRATIVGFVRV